MEQRYILRTWGGWGGKDDAFILIRSMFTFRVFLIGASVSIRAVAWAYMLVLRDCCVFSHAANEVVLLVVFYPSFHGKRKVSLTWLGGRFSIISYMSRLDSGSFACASWVLQT